MLFLAVQLGFFFNINDKNRNSFRTRDLAMRWVRMVWECCLLELSMRNEYKRTVRRRLYIQCSGRNRWRHTTILKRLIDASRAEFAFKHTFLPAIWIWLCGWCFFCLFNILVVRFGSVHGGILLRFISRGDIIWIDELAGYMVDVCVRSSGDNNQLVFGRTRWRFLTTMADGSWLFLVIFNSIKNFCTGTLSWWDDDDVAFYMGLLIISAELQCKGFHIYHRTH